jgi:peptidoglycan DL-endopeptidase CwlO
MSKFLLRRRVSIRTVVAGVAFGALFAGALSGVAGAAPIDSLKAKAATLEAQLNENGAKLDALSEQLNAAQIRLDSAKAKILDAETRIQVAKAEKIRLEELVKSRQREAYKNQGAAGSVSDIDLSSAAEINTRQAYLEAANAKDNVIISELAQARADLVVQKRDARAARQSAQTETSALAASKAQAEAATNDQRALLGQVQGQIGELVRQAQAARAAVARPPSAGKNWSGPVPNPSGGAGAAAAFARSQIGKPYVYAAAGPDAYDCSGLTMRAWQAGGISLPHYSGAQRGRGVPVSLDQLQPGDLITTTEGWSGHVGIWVGGGYVHASSGKGEVTFVSGTSRLIDAVRPT